MFTNSLNAGRSSIQDQESVHDCELCERTFKTLRGLRIHTTKMHRLKKVIIYFYPNFIGKLFESLY